MSVKSSCRAKEQSVQSKFYMCEKEGIKKADTPFSQHELRVARKRYNEMLLK